MRLITFLFLTVTGCTASFAQQVKWTSFEKVQEGMRTDPKPLLVFIHTDWCKFCAMQENKTINDPPVVEKLNSNFYAIRLNAEEKSDITFLNRKYVYQSEGAGSGYHQLAELLGKENGILTFPTILILSETFAVMDRTTGFVSSKDLLKKIDSSLSK
jgi:thioredoxin-related protein